MLGGEVDLTTSLFALLNSLRKQEFTLSFSQGATAAKINNSQYSPRRFKLNLISFIIVLFELISLIYQVFRVATKRRN